ncbi:MAG: FAD:protein FMN transferase, partial [Treponema sp.]|nr:FAD:protein FMN transferase [Treponema sp.]
MLKQERAAKRRNAYGNIFLLLLGLPVFWGCARILPARSELVLGTLCTINLDAGGTAELYGKLFARLKELEGRFSVNRDDTELMKINGAAGITAVSVHPELIAVLERALYFAEASGGAFDPSIGPLVRLWGIGTQEARIPTSAEINEALSLVNWRDIVIDRKAGTVFLPRPGMALDLGAIAKGYAADELIRLIKAAGLPRAVIDLGGNIFAYGEKRGGQPWRIGIQNPLEERGNYMAILEVRNKSVVTSGIYERFFDAGGRRYHHILSTETGYPVDTDLLSVTLIAENSADADALSTAAFALGGGAGRALVESMGAEAVFVSADKGVRC